MCETDRGTLSLKYIRGKLVAHVLVRQARYLKVFITSYKELVKYETMPGEAYIEYKTNNGDI